MSTPHTENDSQLGASPPAIRAQPADRSPLVAAVILTIALCIVYGPATAAPFIFDDKISVVQNASIAELWPLWASSGKPSPLAPAAESVTAGRPLVNLSLALNYRLGKLNPRGYHLVNLVLHLMSAILLWAIVRRTLRLPALASRFASASGSLALAVALVWALHPLNTEAVEYISQRTELMMTLFYLATLWASVHYFQVETRVSRGCWLSLATLACLLGMACKEVMVSAPLVVLMFERTFIAGTFARALRRSWPLYVGLSATWGLLFALHYGGPRAATAGFHLGLPAYVWWLTQAKVLCLYMKLAVWPWPLAIHYGISYLTSLSQAWPWVACTAVLVAVTLALWLRRQPAGFVGAAMLAVLSPTLVVPIVTEVAAERRMYLPLTALVTLVVVGGYSLLKRLPALPPASDQGGTPWPWSPERVTVGLAYAVAIVCGLVSMQRLAVYADVLTFWQDAAASQPDDPLTNLSLGVAFNYAGRFREAMPPLEQALRLEPDSPASGIHKQMGIALSGLGRSADAIENLREALRLEPNSEVILHLLGMALLNAGSPLEAIPYLEQVCRARPTVAEAHVSLGVALLQAGRATDAVEQFQQATQIKPSSILAQATLAQAYAQLGRPSDAIAAAGRALDLARAQKERTQAAEIGEWLRNYRNRRP